MSSEEQYLPAVAAVPCVAAWQADLLHPRVHLCPVSTALLRKASPKSHAEQGIAVTILL